ncbi:hypothetical protein LDENG_00204870 [Lucifuga dentata]|nr:hypothetical protein LDENG_00204870 [Lucifuga dentata]
MIVSNVTCMKIERIRWKHAKWVVLSFKDRQTDRQMQVWFASKEISLKWKKVRHEAEISMRMQKILL